MKVEILPRSEHFMAIVVEFLIFNRAILAFASVLVFNLFP